VTTTFFSAITSFLAAKSLLKISVSEAAAASYLRPPSYLCT
jgi:hypothetical protein